MPLWDGRRHGYVNQAALTQVSTIVNILGQFAGVFGRDLELEMATQKGRIDFIPSRSIEDSINGHRGTLNKSHYQSEESIQGPVWSCAHGRRYNDEKESRPQQRESSNASRRSK